MKQAIVLARAMAPFGAGLLTIGLYMRRTRRERASPLHEDRRIRRLPGTFLRSKMSSLQLDAMSLVMGFWVTPVLVYPGWFIEPRGRAKVAVTNAREIRGFIELGTGRRPIAPEVRQSVLDVLDEISPGLTRAELVFLPEHV